MPAHPDRLNRQVVAQRPLQRAGIELQKRLRKTELADLGHQFRADGRFPADHDLIKPLQRPAVAKQQPAQTCAQAQQSHGAPGVNQKLLAFLAAQRPPAFQLGGDGLQRSQRARAMSWSPQRRA